MIQRPMVNFRGQNALLMMAEDGNARRLRDILDKLGFFVSCCDVSSEDPQTDSAIAGAGVIIVDTDHLDPATVSLLAGSASPIIALIGHEFPSRLQRALEVEPFSVLMNLSAITACSRHCSSRSTRIVGTATSTTSFRPPASASAPGGWWSRPSSA